MPAAFVFVGEMPSISTELVPLNRAIVKIDGTADALHVAEHSPPPGGIRDDVAEAMTGSRGGWRDNDESPLK